MYFALYRQKHSIFLEQSYASWLWKTKSYVSSSNGGRHQTAWCKPETNLFFFIVAHRKAPKRGLYLKIFQKGCILPFVLKTFFLCVSSYMHFSYVYFPLHALTTHTALNFRVKAGSWKRPDLFKIEANWVTTAKPKPDFDFENDSKGRPT